MTFQRPQNARTAPMGLFPAPPPRRRPRWWEVRSWRDAAWLAWTAAGIALAALIASLAVTAAEVAVAFFRYLVTGG